MLVPTGTSVGSLAHPGNAREAKARTAAKFAFMVEDLDHRGYESAKGGLRTLAPSRSGGSVESMGARTITGNVVTIAQFGSSDGKQVVP